jgi:hypothetical protein
MPSNEWVSVRWPTVLTSKKDVVLNAQLRGRLSRFSTGFFVQLRPLPKVLRGLSTSGSQAAATAAG